MVEPERQKQAEWLLQLDRQTEAAGINVYHRPLEAFMSRRAMQVIAYHLLNVRDRTPLLNRQYIAIGTIVLILYTWAFLFPFHLKQV